MKDEQDVVADLEFLCWYQAERCQRFVKLTGLGEENKPSNEKALLASTPDPSALDEIPLFW
jgi:hypothetical protein